MKNEYLQKEVKNLSNFISIKIKLNDLKYHQNQGFYKFSSPNKKGFSDEILKKLTAIGNYNTLNTEKNVQNYYWKDKHSNYELTRFIFKIKLI